MYFEPYQCFYGPYAMGAIGPTGPSGNMVLHMDKKNMDNLWTIYESYRLNQWTPYGHADKGDTG